MMYYSTVCMFLQYTCTSSKQLQTLFGVCLRIFNSKSTT